MDYHSAVLNNEFNVRVQCDGTVHRDNVLDLYEVDREKRLLTSYYQKQFKKKGSDKEMRKLNREVDHGDCVVSKDFLLFKQFFDYEVRLVYWNLEKEYKDLTVTVKIGMPNKVSKKLNNFMKEWSRRILGQSLLIPSLPRDDYVIVSPYEFKFDWDLEDEKSPNVFYFDLKFLFLSDQFENLLGHRTHLLVEIHDGDDKIGDFAFKFYCSKKDQRSVIMKRFTTPTAKFTSLGPVRGLHFRHEHRMTRFMQGQDRMYMREWTSALYGMFQSHMHASRHLFHADNGDTVLKMDLDKTRALRIVRRNLFDPINFTEIHIVIKYETGYEGDKKHRFKRCPFDLDYSKCIFQGFVVRMERTKEGIELTCEYPKYLDKDEFLQIGLIFPSEVFGKPDLEEHIGMLTVTYYKTGSSQPIDQQYAWVSFNQDRSEDGIAKLNKQIVARHPRKAKRRPEEEGHLNTLPQFHLHALFFLKISELNMALPVYVYGQNSQYFMETLQKMLNDLYNRKIGEILTFKIEERTLFDSETPGKYKPLSVNNKSFFEIATTEDVSSDTFMDDGEPTKYAGFNVHVMQDVNGIHINDFTGTVLFNGVYPEVSKNSKKSK